MKRIICLFLFFTLIITASFALESYDSKYYQYYVNARDACYNSKTAREVSEFLEKPFLEIEHSGMSVHEKNYYISLYEYIIGRTFYNEEQKQEAASHYDAALSAVDKALTKTEFDEGFRLKSEIISQMCLVKGIGFILTNGPKVVPLANKALEINPDNGKAIIILGSSKIYTPYIFGGDPEKGIDLMKTALHKPDIERDDFFNIYSGIGIALQNSGDEKGAKEWIDRALELYPENRFLNSPDYKEISDYEKFR